MEYKVADFAELQSALSQENISSIIISERFSIKHDIEISKELNIDFSDQGIDLYDSKLIISKPCKFANGIIKCIGSSSIVVSGVDTLLKLTSMNIIGDETILSVEKRAKIKLLDSNVICDNCESTTVKIEGYSFAKDNSAIMLDSSCILSAGCAVSVTKGGSLKIDNSSLVSSSSEEQPTISITGSRSSISLLDGKITSSRNIVISSQDNPNISDKEGVIDSKIFSSRKIIRTEEKSNDVSESVLEEDSSEVESMEQNDIDDISDNKTTEEASTSKATPDNANQVSDQPASKFPISYNLKKSVKCFMTPSLKTYRTDVSGVIKIEGQTSKNGKLYYKIYQKSRKLSGYIEHFKLS